MRSNLPTPRRVWEAVQEAPYPMWIACGSVLAGSAQFALWQFSAAVTSLIGHSWAVVWSAYLLVGGLLVIFGFSKHRPSYEVLGLLFMSLGLVVYAAAQWEYAGIPALIPVATNLTIAIAHLTRARYLTKITGGRAKWIKTQSS